MDYSSIFEDIKDKTIENENRIKILDERIKNAKDFSLNNKIQRILLFSLFMWFLNTTIYPILITYNILSVASFSAVFGVLPYVAGIIFNEIYEKINNIKVIKKKVLNKNKNADMVKTLVELQISKEIIEKNNDILKDSREIIHLDNDIRNTLIENNSPNLFISELNYKDERKKKVNNIINELSIKQNNLNEIIAKKNLFKIHKTKPERILRNYFSFSLGFIVNSISMLFACVILSVFFKINIIPSISLFIPGVVASLSSLGLSIKNNKDQSKVFDEINNIYNFNENEDVDLNELDKQLEEGKKEASILSSSLEINRLRLLTLPTKINPIIESNYRSYIRKDLNKEEEKAKTRKLV